MPGFLGGSSSGGGSGGEISFPKEFVDPVTKLRVSEPETLIDTDFEYGLQPTKWETVELINNTPSFFSKSGDTTIDNIVSVTTNAGTREITVTTSLEHGLAIGIPINVTGTKSITADGAYIINSIPNSRTFTYLCKDNQNTTSSIEDLYTSIITGEFFQGSQLRIATSDGIVTDGESLSTLTVKTESNHGFGVNTPFYFLNLNSTVSQEFEAANTATRSFDSSNSATAQTFDGSNTLSQTQIDWSNSAVVGGATSTVTSVSAGDDTITVSHGTENFSGSQLGTPLYYNVVTAAGYFANNPRGVVFLLTNDQLGTSTSTFKVSAVPDGTAIDIEASMTGTFQLANQARIFAGNNTNPLTETTLEIIRGSAFEFEGANDQGAGGGGATSNGLSTVTSFSGSLVNVSVSTGAGLGYYQGAMVFYSSTGSAASGLTNNTTYFIDSFFATGANSFAFTLKPLPTSATITSISGGSGTQTFTRIGVSADRNVIHVKDSNFTKGDMVEYTYPVGGNFDSFSEQNYYFIETVYDAHNYQLSAQPFAPITATGGSVTEISANGRSYRVHTFTGVGTSNFVVSDAGSEAQIEYLVVGGGGGGGSDMGGGGGAGGVLQGTATVTAGTYTITVGSGGNGALAGTGQLRGSEGNPSSIFKTADLNIVALGGGGGASCHDRSDRPAGGVNLGLNVASGGGASGGGTLPSGGSGGGGYGGGIRGTGTFPQGNDGGTGIYAWYPGGGGGAGGAGGTGTYQFAMGGGIGVESSILGPSYYFGGGGGGSGYSNFGGYGGLGGGGGGAVGFTRGGFGLNNGSNGGGGATNAQTNTPGGDAGANTGGGGGGGAHYFANNRGGNGGSGIVVIRYRITKIDPIPMIATGGQTTTDVQIAGLPYRIHSFTTVGTHTFSVTRQGNIGNVEVLVVGGGGGGGGAYGAAGGGGAGGLVYHPAKNLSVGNYGVTVGGGGVGGVRYIGLNNSTSTQHGRQGSNSVFSDITAIGGGGGTMSFYFYSDLRFGGSGGGAGDYYQNSSWVGGDYQQGNSGGGYGFGYHGGSRGPSGPQGPISTDSRNEDGGHAQPHEGAGGGGAGGTSTESRGDNPSNGGIGRQYPQFAIHGFPIGWFAGGGAGGTHYQSRTPMNNGRGGWFGGGGRGANERADSNGVGSSPSTVGATNTGGGGGGGATNYGGGSNSTAGLTNGANGGSGIVVVGYPLSTPTFVHKDLLVALDAGNSASYTGDNLWRNISLMDSLGNTSLNPINFTLVGPPAFSSGVGGGSFTFNGTTSQYAQFANFYGSKLIGDTPQAIEHFDGNASYEAWVRPTVVDATARHVFTDSDFNEGELEFSTSGIRAYWGGSSTALWAVAPTANTWYHVVVTHEKDYRSNLYHTDLYVNGVFRARSSGTRIQDVSTYGPDGNLNIGYQWSGQISVFRIYTRVFTTVDVQQNFNALRARHGL